MALGQDDNRHVLVSQKRCQLLVNWYKNYKNHQQITVPLKDYSLLFSVL
jgi:hypothetical protein